MHNQVQILQQQHSLNTCQRIGQKATKQINHKIYAQLEATKLCWDVSQEVIPGQKQREKHFRGMKQQTHLHPPEQKSPPFGIHELYSYPQTLRPSPGTQKRAMYLKMLVALQWPQSYSQGQRVWMPVSDLIHSLIS